MNNSSSIGEVAIDIIHNISNTIDNDEITVRGSFPRSHTKESSVDPTDIGLLKHKRQSPHEDLFLCNRDLEKNKISSYNLKGENNRFVILLDDDDCDGINEMRRWQESDENNSKTMEDIIEKFKNRYKVADALARILYNDPFPDFILKFKNEIADDISTNTSIRNQFELLLLKTGLIVEHEDDSILKNFTYLKVWVPFYKLCDAADQMRLKVRLITKDNQIICKQKVEKNRLHQFFTKSFLRHINHQKRSAFFKKDRLREFEGADLEKEWSHIALNFWKGSRRNLLAQHLIINANVIQRKVQSADLNIPNFYQKQRIRQFSIENLLNQEVYVGFFPLHDGLLNKGSNTEPRNQRTFLYRNWVKSSDFQPLDEVRDYFGEKYGMYFAWLGLYTTWLLVATILGCITVLYGLIVVASKSYFKNGVAGISLIWDNALTFPFAVVMSIWGTCFLESWKRYNAALVHDWDLGEFEEEEQLSPDFNGTAIRQSMITSKQELYYPLQKRYKKLFFTSSVIVISMGIVLLTIGSLLTFSRFWFHEGVWNNVLASLVNLVTVLIMDVAYFYIAKWLTQVENHRTLASYEDSLIGKLYLFDFVNFYSALFYILLFKEKFVRNVLKQDNENGCEYQSCMMELTIQLGIIFVGKQALGQIYEISLPLIQSKFFGSNFGKKIIDETKHPQWENDDRLAIADADQIRAEYEEMVVQFGFISLFAPAFPLAPLFAWINNLSEIRGDAFKYIQTRKRPVGLLAQNIGMWNNILNFISFLSVLTNATILAFHSTYVNDLFHKYVGDSDKELLNARLVFILIFENFIFLIKITLGYFIPDIPKSVSNAFKREKYLERVDLEGDIIAADDFPEEEEIKDDSQVNKEALGEFKKAIEKLKSCTVVPGRWRDS